jgi:predicted  nucleic acid-binding Zn-ribbon protein
MTDTKDIKALLQQELNRLAEIRDELRVQLKLAKADAQEEWNKLEVTWERVQEELQRVATHTKEPVQNIGAAARQLLDELKQGYERVRAQVKASKQ